MSSEPLVSPDSGLWTLVQVGVVFAITLAVLGAGAVWKRYGR